MAFTHYTAWDMKEATLNQMEKQQPQSETCHGEYGKPNSICLPSVWLNHSSFFNLDSFPIPDIPETMHLFIPTHPPKKTENKQTKL